MKYTRLFLFLIISFFFLTFASAQERLSLNGKDIFYKNKPIYLHGANTIAEINKINESDAENFRLMGMNFVRLLIDIDTEIDINDNEGDGDFIKQSALDNWKTVTHWFTSRKIWVNVELRSNDYDLSTSDFWILNSPLHHKIRKVWKGLVSTLKNENYIAAWGILAEHGQAKRTTLKEIFKPIMMSIDSLDGNTPFTFGPKLNSIDYYDFVKYDDLYWPEYANRIIYQINHLHPKPFINKDPSKGYDPATWWYHRTDGQNGAGADNDGSMNKAGNIAHFTPGFIWRDHYNAPIYIDQWGCDFTQPGYLDYERDMLEIFKENGNIPNTRWTYFMSGARGIMTDFYGSWELHKPLFDFFSLSNNEDLIWPHEVSVSEPNAADNHLTTEASKNTLPWNIDFKFSAPFASNKIELWNGNSDFTEDPSNINVYASNDSSNWTLLANLPVSFAGRRSQYISTSFINTSSYIFYRAQILNNNGGSKTILTNLEFFPNSQTLVTNLEKEIISNTNRNTFQNGFLINLNITNDILLKTYDLQIALINSFGQIIESKNLDAIEVGSVNIFDLSHQQDGIYFVKVTGNNINLISKHIK